MNAKIIAPGEGLCGFLGTISVRFMIDAAETDNRFSLVEHPMAPRTLAAPLHRHTREDEFSYVLDGTMGALLGDKTFTATKGDLVFKPRNQWHTFWNAGDASARILEIITPAGFEQFFKEVINRGGITAMAPAELDTLCDSYGLEMNAQSVPDLVQRFGLKFPGTPEKPYMIY